MRPLTPIKDRFWKFVERIPFHECWEWIGRTSGRYGSLQEAIAPGIYRNVYMHRLSYQLHYGPIPQGLCVCHKCDNTRCVNPKHLFLGTYQDNVDDMIGKGRQAICHFKKQIGEKNCKAKLKEKDINKIRELNKRGLSPVQIGEIYRVSSTHISGIIRGKYWKHVPPQD